MPGVILVTRKQRHKLGPCLWRMRYICYLFGTLVVTLVAILVWSLPLWVVFLPAEVFVLVDGLYLSSALNKVPDGRLSKENQWHTEADDCFKPYTLVMKNGESKLALTLRWGGGLLSSVSGFGIFFNKTGVLTPRVFTYFASKLGAFADVSVFFHLYPAETPSVSDEERYHISRSASIPGCYRLVVRHGFMDEVVSLDLGVLIYEQVRKFVVHQVAAKSVEAGLR
ncbi:hypothetical protein EDB81DRAFT_765415 [Dactylonectria macrodidyma]|uniref:K+ potassium transporter C-terminal domain-containing protein n=1 Tax=Dactylonectria macrodidyma TaxID=307937 RepID=A0A9P9DSS7_9HYPO|nr:hypothetical protein EDB81DRAFT_765415 [Dactylonectria macrodidyma]